jgi:hypothetical protein
MTPDNSDEEIYGLKKAVSEAWATLAKQNPEEVVTRTQCILGETSQEYILRFLGEDYIIDPGKNSVTTVDGQPFFNLFKIGIMLHYMTHAKEQPLENKLISFRELWGGNEYYYAFNNRVLKPLTEHFTAQPQRLLDSGLKLDGGKIDSGEYGLRIPALPRVPVTVLYWSGDDEVAASANVLFDGSANQQMETEAIVWLAVATVSELKKKTE